MVRGFTPTPHHIEREPALTPCHRRDVLLYVAGRVGTGSYPLSQKRIATDLGVSVPTVQRATRWLTLNGYLRTIRQADAKGHRSVNVYTLGAAWASPPSHHLTRVLGITGDATQEEPEKETPAHLVDHCLTTLKNVDPPLACPGPTRAESGPTTHTPKEQPRASATSSITSRMTAIERVLDSLQRKRKITSGWIASCPVPGHGQGNGDKNPSLSISEHNGKVLLNCQSGCHVQDVLLALHLDYPDLFDEPIAEDRGVKVAEWTYVNHKGEPWFIAERWQTATGKRFEQRAPGADKPGLGKNFYFCLYRLPQVLQARDNHEEIWLVEGEKSVHAALSLGLVATTAPLGAGKWRAEYNRHLVGVKCVNIVIDNDGPGRDHAKKVQQSLAEAGIPTKVWKVAVTDAKADLYDHVARGYGVEDLRPTRLDVTVPTTWSFRQALTAVFPERQWVIDEVLPTGMCLLSGPSKIGKSVLAVGMSLAVASGQDWIKRFKVNQGAVLHLGLDNEGMRDLVERFKEAKSFYNIKGLDASIELNEALREGAEGESAIGELARTMIRGWHTERLEIGETPRLVVVDTLSKIEPDWDGSQRRTGGSDYNGSTSSLSPWAQMAMELDIALVCVHHSTKSDEGSWVNRGFMGSRGLTATAHTLMFLDAKHGANDGTLHVTGRHVPTVDYPLVRKGMQWEENTYGTSRTVKPTASGNVVPLRP